MHANQNFHRVLQRALPAVICLLLCATFYACRPDSDSGGGGGTVFVMVNSLLDEADPAPGVVTLRSAMDNIPAGGTIVFSPLLNGGVILLTIVGEEHSILKGESYAGGPFQGYVERDYGKSALYANKNLTIDASNLPDGITIAWGGGDSDPARVLAVYGDLAMNGVTLTGGFSMGEAVATDQLFTLARGGGLATWGTAILNDCVIHGNKVLGDYSPSRDRGAMGGGIYANLLVMNDCVVSGNRVKGYGATGGGVYSVGGEGMPLTRSSFNRCSICGNRTTGQHSYGGGVFTEGGGRGGDNYIELINCTIARNLVEDNPDLSETGGGPGPPVQYYYRGGGVYMTNGSLAITSSTIVENQVTGIPAIFRGRPNMSGGGVASTIGDAHQVEYINVTHSIIAGNVMDGRSEDLYSGSLLHFISGGHNRLGVIDFTEILVPIPAWLSLSRKHYPKVGDADGYDLAAIVALAGASKHATILSAGTDDGASVVLSYPPVGDARDQIPPGAYGVSATTAQYTVLGGQPDDFLFQALEKLRNDFGLGAAFGTTLNYTGVTWSGVDETWPSDPANADWITFWRQLDVELGDSLGAIKLGDDFWSDFSDGPLGANVEMEMDSIDTLIEPLDQDQLGVGRPQNVNSDVGAVER